ncbi:MAG TPA: hypothetical protein VF017_17380 [Thermoanaerobaculia bacterium]|nr:hypothetical protein [Thermoanaerobaculia bacterium]
MPTARQTLPGLLLVAAALSLGSARPATAFSPRTQATIAEEAAHLAPPDLRRQMLKHVAELRRGTAAPFADGNPPRHFENPDGSGELTRAIQIESERAIEAIRTQRPFADIVYHLGVVAHYVADANNPLNASNADSSERRYFGDYLGYVETVSPRLPLVFYGFADRRLDRPMARLAARALARSRRLYPLVGEEYRRVRFQPARAAFDDRSTAFAVASLSFSHAVTDVAQAFHWIWLEGGGGDTRRRLDPLDSRLRALPRRTERQAQ